METKSYKLAFTVTYDDGENQFQSTPYIFAKTTAKPEEKPDDNNNNNNAQPETPQEPQGGGESLAGGVTKHGSDHLRRRKWRWNFYCFSTASDRDRV